MQPPVNQTLEILQLWHRVTSACLHELPFDLSARQMAVLTTTYLTEGPHTIRNLSETLHISKPAVCRAVDTLSMMDLIKRRKDEQDRRNVFIQRTVKGSVFLSDLADLLLREIDTDLLTGNLASQAVPHQIKNAALNA